MTPDARLRQILEEKGLTQQNVAELLKVTRQSIGHYLSGERKITWPVAYALAFRLGINPDWLMEGKGRKFLRTEGAISEK